MTNKRLILSRLAALCHVPVGRVVRARDPSPCDAAAGACGQRKGGH